MRILFDHCVPRSLRRSLTGHQVKTTAECGWADFNNGDLLAKAALEFDVFLTVDQNIAFQQNLRSIPLSVVVLVATDNRVASLTPLIPALERALASITGRQLVRIHTTGEIEVLPGL